MNMHVKRPDLAVDSIPSKLADQHRRAAKARQRVRKLREKAFAEIERLIAFLDASDGYTMDELEVNGDEADASFPEHSRFCAAPMEDDEDDGCSEPSLGSLQPYGEHSGAIDQRTWSHGAMDDREGDPGCDDKEPSLCGIHADSGCSGTGHDHEEDESDKEPSLGWTSEESARGIAYAGSMGRNADCEEDAGDMPEYDPAELGLADMDAIKEQIGQSGGFCYSEVL
jgi:hypothetical protein